MYALTVIVLIVAVILLLTGLVRSIRAMFEATRRPVVWEE